MQCILNRVFLQTNAKAVVYLAVDINPSDAGVVEANAQRPLNVCVAIDRSGSMRAENKLDKAKIATLQLVQSLKPTDYISVVSFSNTERVEVVSQPAGNFAIFQLAVQSIKASGYTNLYSALTASFQEVAKQREFFLEPPVSRIILLTDGQPTSGQKTVEEFMPLCEEIRKNDTSITTLGLGSDYNERLLTAIASKTGGLPLHVSDSNTLQQFFSQELSDMKTVVMIKPELRIQPVSGAEIMNVHKVRPVLDLIQNPEIRNDKYIVPLGDIVGGQPQNVVFKIALPPKVEGTYRIAQVELVSGKDTVTCEVLVNYTNDVALYSKETNSYPRVLLLTSQGTILLRQGVSMSDPAKINQAQTILTRTMSDPNAVTVVKTNELTRDLVNRFNNSYEITVVKKGSLTEEEKKQVASQTTVIKKK
jgi:Ca-activated chloride channel homolog